MKLGIKKYNKIIIGAIILLIAIALFNSKNRIKNEGELINDLKSNANFFPYCELSISDYQIIKRKTDKKEKTDVVYVTVEAENLDLNVNCILSYEMKYVLYNDGWILEEVNRYSAGDWEISKPTSELILDEIYRQIPFFEKNKIRFIEPELKYIDVSTKTPQTEYIVEFLCEENCESFKAVAAGQLCYVLSSEGWRFQEENSYIDKSSTKLIPLIGVDEKIARNMLNGVISSNVSEVEAAGKVEDFENQNVTYYYNCFTYYNYMTLIETYRIDYCFSNENGQRLNMEVYEVSETEDWSKIYHIYEIEDVKSTGFMSSGNYKLRVKINQFDGYELNAGYQDINLASDIQVQYSTIDGNYRALSSEVKEDSPYKYLSVTRTGGNGADVGFVLLIDKDSGVSIRRLKFGQHEDTWNVEHLDFIVMKQVK